MEREDLIFRIESLGFDFDTIVLCSENGKIISVMGDDTNLSKNLPDLCSVIHSIGFKLTKTVDKGDYIYTIIRGKDGNILIHPYKNYCLVALLRENNEPHLFQPAF